MTPGARVAAAIELLTLIRQTWEGTERRPADGIMAQYFKGHRYIGAKDRGYVSGLVYQVLRNKASIEWQIQKSRLVSSPRTWVIVALADLRNTTQKEMINLFSNSQYISEKINERELALTHRIAERAANKMPAWVEYNVPEWVLPILHDSLEHALKTRGLYKGGDTWMGEELSALNKEASVDLRVNTLKGTREALLKKLRAEEFEPEVSPLSPTGIRLSKRAAIFASPSFKEGLFEVQDEGSQIVAQLCGAKPGMRVIDFCAGAGGKTLALAALMGNKGKILAFDTSKKRMEQMKPRLKRAGVDTVECHVIEDEKDKFLKRHAASADIVLVDAPCTGTGTWRRNPDMKWRMRPQDIDELTALQHRILQSASRLVKPGGSLVYATCSFLNAENFQQVEKFLVDNVNFKVVATEKLWDKLFSYAAPRRGNALQLTPQQDGTDGFFVAVLEKRAA